MTILADPVRSNVVWASQGENMTTSNVVRNASSAVPGTWTTTAGVPSGFVSGLSVDRSRAEAGLG